MVAVSFRNVSKVFVSKAGAITALDDVNAEVPAGYLVHGLSQLGDGAKKPLSQKCGYGRADQQAEQNLPYG